MVPQGPCWLQGSRRLGIASFATLPFPGPDQRSLAWSNPRFLIQWDSPDGLFSGNPLTHLRGGGGAWGGVEACWQVGLLVLRQGRRGARANCWRALGYPQIRFCGLEIPLLASHGYSRCRASIALG